MPACLVGDLSAEDAAWLADHTASCGYCARELGCFERVGGAIDQICASDLAPPPVALPRARVAHYGKIESPVGPLFVAVSEAGLCEIDFAGDAGEVAEAAFRSRLTARGFRPEGVGVGPTDSVAACDRESIAGVARQLAEYFGGRRDRFDLPLDLSGVTPFTRKVLAATSEVPFGRLETYQGIARRVGKPGASRAVGNALGRNPIPVVVPCHRVVRSGGGLGGYTGGLQIKQHLLGLEGVTLG